MFVFILVTRYKMCEVQVSNLYKYSHTLFIDKRYMQISKAPYIHGVKMVPTQKGWIVKQLDY